MYVCDDSSSIRLKKTVRKRNLLSDLRYTEVNGN